MSVRDYLKTVSAYLSRASLAKRQEADGRRRDITLKNQEMNKLVEDLERQIRERQTLLASTDTDTARRSRWVRDIRDMEERIAEVRRNFDQEKGRINDEVHYMENQARDFQSQADDFIRKADVA